MKNIILISLDSLREDVLGCYGDKLIKTPNIDDLARKGILFNTVIAQAPYTVPSHASILTGLYPFNHGLRKQYAKSKLAKDSLLCLRILKRLGFKLFSFVGVNLFGHEYGYNLWDFYARSKILTIKRKLQANKNKPFFAFIHYWRVHTPYHNVRLSRGLNEWIKNRIGNIVKNDFIYITKAERLYEVLLRDTSKKIKKIREAMKSDDSIAKREIESGYRRSVELADGFVGNIIRLLKDMNLLQKTLIIVTSDHGESFNEHGEIEEFPNDYEHGPFLYDTVIKVPMIIYDRNLPSGKVVEQQVQSIDILPTIFDILGKYNYIESKVNGRSLINYVLSDIIDDEYKYAYSETMKDTPSIKDSVVKKMCIRSNDGYKLVIDHKVGNIQLFNCNDGENQDIKEEQPLIIKKLREALENFVKESKIELVGEDKIMGEKNYKKVTEILRDLGYM